MRYIINEKEKMVIAIMNNTENDAIDFLWANYKNIKPFIQLIEDGHANDKTLKKAESDFTYDSLNKLRLKKHYIGKAKVYAGDTFNKETGMKIAAAKAKYKHDKAMRKIVSKTLEAELNDINNAIAKMEFKFCKSTDDIMMLEYL